MKKKSFILLELLIAFALISLSVLPFIHFPQSHIKQEIKTLFLTELENTLDQELVQMYVALHYASTKGFVQEKKPLASPSSSQAIALGLLTSFFNQENPPPSPLKKYRWDEEFRTFSLPGSSAKKNILIQRSVFCKKRGETSEGKALVFLILRVSIYEKRGIRGDKWKQLCSADLKVTCSEH